MKALSDKQAAEIIKAMHDVQEPTTYTISTIGDRPIISITPIRCHEIQVKDPRYDTDAALELLGWLERTRRITNVEIDFWFGENPDNPRVAGSCWEIEICDNEPEIGMGNLTHFNIPLSGQPFCTAVCNLAVKVTGVEV